MRRPTRWPRSTTTACGPRSGRFPRDQSVAIALRYGADLSVEEIAETLQSTVPAVKSLLHRARAALRASPALKSYTE